MIVWFSGTGNSRYVASQLARELGQDCSPLMQTGPASFLRSGESVGMVFPIYSWGLPAPVIDFVNHMRSNDAAPEQYLWVVMTCGDETGDAPAMLRALMAHRGISPAAMFSVIMPNNYVLLPGFDVDDKTTEERKLQRAPARIKEIAAMIAQRRNVIDVTSGSWPRLRTRTVYPLFRRWGINPSRFHADARCISCGRCVKSCPMDNITLDDCGHPRWDNDCVSCLACYHVCPVECVQYGKATRGKGHYICPLK